MQGERNIDEWSKELASDAPAGHGATAPTESGNADHEQQELAALRSVIQAEDRQATLEAEHDEVGLARLLKRLETEGLLQPRKSRLTKWQGWMGAIAATIAIAIGVLILNPRQPTTIERGFAGSVTIVTAEPDATALRVAQELAAMGLQPKRGSVDGRIVIDVEVSQEALPVFYDWAAARDARAVAPGKYRIFVDAEK